MIAATRISKRIAGRPRASTPTCVQIGACRFAVRSIAAKTVTKPAMAASENVSIARVCEAEPKVPRVVRVIEVRAETFEQPHQPVQGM